MICIGGGSSWTGCIRAGCICALLYLFAVLIIQAQRKHDTHIQGIIINTIKTGSFFIYLSCFYFTGHMIGTLLELTTNSD